MDVNSLMLPGGLERTAPAMSATRDELASSAGQQIDHDWLETPQKFAGDDNVPR